jgi:hypothetical protein
MPTVRTTMWPDVEIEVDQADYLDLKRQGLLVDPPKTDPAQEPAVKKTAASAHTTTSKEG